MKNNEFRVLFIYSNVSMLNMLPIGTSSLLAVLRENKFDVRLFDTTAYKTEGKTIDQIRVETLDVRPFSYEDKKIRPKEANMIEDFKKLVDTFKPHVIAASCTEVTYLKAVSLLEAVSDKKIVTLFGGVYPILAPEKVLKNELINYICVGEGERTIVKFCEHLAKGEDPAGTPNIWTKRNGKIIKGPPEKLMDLRDVPFLDFSLFEEERFYRPMQGKIYKMIPLETSRGCPYQCTYCGSPALARALKEHGRYYRLKEVERLKLELNSYVKQYHPDYIYIVSDTFLATSDEWFNAFAEMYKPFHLPFWCNTRAETITEERAKILKEINCNRANIGIESGNEKIRNEVLNKHVSDESIFNAFKILNKNSIAVTANIIIGLPTETRENIFDSVKFLRKLQCDSIGVYIFEPYEGTQLREYCVKNGYMSDEIIAENFHAQPTPGLHLPNLSHDEILGLRRTFPLYVKMDESMWPEIERAEKFDKEGNETFQKLAKLYWELH